MNWRARYEAGEYEAVWDEMQKASPLEGALQDEATEVATFTMRRVRRNVAILSKRLRQHGWLALYDDLHTPACDDFTTTIKAIEARINGPIPLALRMFWQIVGSVNFVWDYNFDPDYKHIGFDVDLLDLDPFCIDPPRLLATIEEDWRQREDGGWLHNGSQYPIELAPDHYHKANVSGGDSYKVFAPSLDVDPLFDAELCALSFTNYLRLAFRWAGFPGLCEHRDDPDVQAFVNK
ncbi:MAG: hypothetical protein AAGJ87_08840, partial [Pseudomonadota bacterium]